MLLVDCENSILLLSLRLLDAFENQSREHTWTHKASSPLVIPRRCWLRGNDFIEGSSLLLQSRYFVAGINEQITIESKFRLVSDRTVSWDDDCVIRDFGEIRFGGPDHSVNAAAS